MHLCASRGGEQHGSWQQAGGTQCLVAATQGEPATAAHADGEIHVTPPKITGQGDSLKAERDEYARVAKLAAELEALRVNEHPVFVTMGRTVGPAGYGVTGLLNLTLRLSPRVRAQFETKGET